MVFFKNISLIVIQIKLVIIFNLLLVFYNLSLQAQPTQKIGANGQMVASIAFSPNSYFLATAGTDNVIDIWEINSNSCVKTLKGHTGWINTIAYSKDGKYLASGGLDQYVIIWDVQTFQRKHLIKKDLNTAINSLAFSADGKILAVGCVDNNIRLYATESGMLIKILPGHKKEITSVQFSNNDKYLISASKDKTIRFWDYNNNITSKILEVKSGYVSAIRLTPKDEYLVAGLSSGIVKIWDCSTFVQKNAIEAHKKNIQSIAISPDGGYILTGSSDNSVKLIEFNSGNVINHYKDFIYGVKEVAFSPNGLYFAATEERKKILIWNIESLGIAQRLEENKAQAVVEFKKIEEEKNRTPDNQPATRKRINKGDTTKPIISLNTTRSSSDWGTTEEKQILLKGKVTDDSGIYEVNVISSASPSGEEPLLAANGEFQIIVRLVLGENIINIEATDINENKTSQQLKIIRVREAKSELEELESYENPKNYLFIIGINNYSHWPRLNNAVNDAQQIKKVLLENYQFTEENTIELYDQIATRSNIYKTFEKLAGLLRPQDNLLVYYSGHGHYNPKLSLGFWVPVEAQINATEDYIPNGMIQTFVKAINSKHTFLIIDACFSGSLFAQGSRGYVENVEKLKSRWGLASGRLEVVSDGTIGTNSPFCKYLLSYLTNNQKEKLPVSELIQYVKTAVANNSDQTPEGNPLKDVGDEGGEFIFYRK
jgi:WD40 repeat protein